MFDLSTTTMIIYKITNIVNGKVYIGQSQNSFNKRYDRKGEGAERVFLQHKAAKERGDSYNIHLYNAMEKYGVENFTVEIIEQCKTVSKLNSREKYYIKLYNSADPDFGYNVQLGGGSRQYTTKMKKQKIRQKREDEVNQYSFLVDIFDDNVIYAYVDETVLHSISINMRVIYILLAVLYDNDVYGIDMECLYECLPKKGRSRQKILIDILDNLQGEEIIKYTIDEEMVYFTVLKSGTKEIELLILYHIDLLASIDKYARFLKKETILKKCKVCDRFICVPKTSANTKYCEYCRKEIDKEKKRVYNKEKRAKNSHPQS